MNKFIKIVRGETEELLELRDLLEENGYKNSCWYPVSPRTRARVMIIDDMSKRYKTSPRLLSGAISFRVFMETSGFKYRDGLKLANDLMDKHVEGLTREQRKDVLNVMMKFNELMNKR